MESTIMKLAKKNIVVVIENATQERHLKHLCKEYKIPLVKRSDDVIKEKGSTSLYPIYYGFFFYCNDCVSWHSYSKETAASKKPLLLTIKSFKMNLEECML